MKVRKTKDASIPFVGTPLACKIIECPYVDQVFDHESGGTDRGSADLIALQDKKQPNTASFPFRQSLLFIRIFRIIKHVPYTSVPVIVILLRSVVHPQDAQSAYECPYRRDRCVRCSAGCTDAVRILSVIHDFPLAPVSDA